MPAGIVPRDLTHRFLLLESHKKVCMPWLDGEHTYFVFFFSFFCLLTRKLIKTFKAVFIWFSWLNFRLFFIFLFQGLFGKHSIFVQFRRKFSSLTYKNLHLIFCDYIILFIYFISNDLLNSLIWPWCDVFIYKNAKMQKCKNKN